MTFTETVELHGHIIDSYALPHVDPSGEWLGYVGVSPDITERKHAEAALRQSVQARDEFLGKGVDLVVRFHLRHEVRVAPVGDVVDAADVRMCDLPSQPYLGMQLLEELGIFREMRREELQSDGLTELQIIGAIDVEDVLGRLFSTFCVGK